MNKHFSKYGFYCRILLIIVLFAGCATSRQAERAHKAAEEAQKEAIKERYALKLEVDTANLTNYPLYSFIDEWYGIPYHYGGHSKDGIDCSDFASILYLTVYGKQLSGTAGDLFQQCVAVKKDSLQEGDLVFFRIKGKYISHVGVYLMNDKFVHASVHGGVIISSLNESYYKLRFYKGGRLKS